ncbi:hypothetical protein AV545_04220 [Paenibacillus jamilae]|uniref:hypothetical protein n=1 Tax=Paenibacillus jamilae TaxID=114136 RepID=UPI0007AB6C2B|nr:hypothetical protein [Paenibacillus jamilae]KZE65136.1 hypothetical protein AV545_04220 [Paenibacillus jamilae]
MKINEIGTLNLNETVFKLSDNSITARVNNKTKAVINDVQSVKTLPFNRKVELNVKFKSKLNNFFEGLYISADQRLFYIIDQKYHESVLISYNNGWKEEAERLFAKVTELTELKVNVLYLNVA